MFDNKLLENNLIAMAHVLELKRHALISFAFANGLQIKFYSCSNDGPGRVRCTFTLHGREPYDKDGNELYGKGDNYQDAFDDLYADFHNEVIVYKVGVGPEGEQFKIPFNG